MKQCSSIYCVSVDLLIDAVASIHDLIGTTCLNSICYYGICQTCLFFDLPRSNFDQSRCLLETMGTLQQHDLAFFDLQTTYDEHDVSKAFRKFMAMHHPDKARTIFDCDLVAKSQNVRNRLLAALDSQKPITVDIPMLSPTTCQSWGFEINETTMELTKLHTGQHFQRECDKAKVVVTVGWVITKINGQKHDASDYDLRDILQSLHGLEAPVTITLEEPKVKSLPTGKHVRELQRQSTKESLVKQTKKQMKQVRCTKVGSDVSIPIGAKQLVVYNEQKKVDVLYSYWYGEHQTIYYKAQHPTLEPHIQSHKWVTVWRWDKKGECVEVEEYMDDIDDWEYVDNMDHNAIRECDAKTKKQRIT